MRVKVIKSGKWSLKGIKNIDIEEGDQDMHSDLALELIKAGWAEEIKEKEEKKEEAPKKKKAKAKK